MTRCPRRAFTLLEALTVMVSLGLTLSLGAIILIVSMRSNQVGATTLLHVRLHTDIADLFRADVAAATDAPETLDQWTRGPACLILQKSANDFVVYQWKDSDLIRTVKSRDGVAPSILSLGLPKMAVAFDSTAGERPLVTLRLSETLERRAPRQYEFSAALGGDRR